MERMTRHAIEIGMGLALGGVIAALTVGTLHTQGIPIGPWVWWLATATGVATTVWYGERIHRQAKSLTDS